MGVLFLLMFSIVYGIEIYLNENLQTICEKSFVLIKFCGKIMMYFLIMPLVISKSISDFEYLNKWLYGDSICKIISFILFLLIIPYLLFRAVKFLIIFLPKLYIEGVKMVVKFLLNYPLRILKFLLKIIFGVGTFIFIIYIFVFVKI
jgi:hypothetical protein